MTLDDKTLAGIKDALMESLRGVYAPEITIHPTEPGATGLPGVTWSAKIPVPIRTYSMSVPASWLAYRKGASRRQKKERHESVALFAGVGMREAKRICREASK